MPNALYNNQQIMCIYIFWEEKDNIDVIIINHKLHVLREDRSNTRKQSNRMHTARISSSGKGGGWTDTLWTQTLPFRQTRPVNRHVRVKTLPCPKLRLKKFWHLGTYLLYRLFGHEVERSI